MVCSNDKQVRDFYFTILKYINCEDPKLVCTFVQNKNTLRGFIWKLKLMFGTYIYGVESNEIKKMIMENIK